MELTVVPITKPDAANFIFGQSHFIKTVEDLHEALVGAVPGIRFGLAFCDVSGCCAGRVMTSPPSPSRVITPWPLAPAILS
jgi:adenosine/AMP kinase